jgi:hypothetical protein
MKQDFYLLGFRKKIEHNDPHVFTDDLKKFTGLLLIMLAGQGLKLYVLPQNQYFLRTYRMN